MGQLHVHGAVTCTCACMSPPVCVRAHARVQDRQIECLSLSLSLSLSLCVCVGGWVCVRREEKGLACRNSYKNHIFHGENHTKIKFSMEKINACVCVLCAPQRIRLDLLERPLALQHTFVIHTQTSTHIDIHTHTNTDTRTHTLTHTHSLTHTCMHHI